jgi:hypothetical protein
MTATWKILKTGRVPAEAPSMLFTCPGCGREALLPVRGLPLAQVAAGVVFDTADYALPREIECRACRRRFVTEGRR